MDLTATSPRSMRPPCRPPRVRPSRQGEVRVRPATRRDHPAIREVLRAAYREFARDMPAELFDAYLQELADLDRRAGEAELVVAEVRGAVVGTISYYPDAEVQGMGWPAGWAGLRTLGVAPGARGLGVGRKLIAYCLDRAERQGAGVACLHTAHFMTAAIALYERSGFRRAEQFDIDLSGQHETAGGEGLRIIAYTRAVDAS